jgi:D-alanine--poly(phosphoribitol) ligase subunit 2
MESEKITQVIYDIIDETNAGLPPNRQIEKSGDAVLFGRNGTLESLELVHFIVAVEDRVREELGASITLADERAMSQKSSPFRNVSSLSGYIVELMEQEP